MIPSYEDYRDEFEKSFKEWVHAVFHAGKSRQSELQNETEELIDSWKKMYPTRITEISRFVQSRVQEAFS
jgi:hypothetical protein